MKGKRKAKPFKNPADDPRVSALLQDWSALSRADRGKRIAPFRLDYSGRELARVLPCSEKELRNCVDLWRLSQKQTKLGNKKKLSIARALRAVRRKWKKMSTGAAGKRLRRRLVRTLVVWFDANLDPVLWDRFFYELDWSPEARARVFAGAPWNERNPDGDWKAIILATCPTRSITDYNREFWSKYEQFGGRKTWPAIREQIRIPEDPRDTRWSESSLFSVQRNWLAAWLPRCVLDARFAKSALEETRLRLREKAIREFGATTAVQWFNK